MIVVITVCAIAYQYINNKLINHFRDITSGKISYMITNTTTTEKKKENENIKLSHRYKKLPKGHIVDICDDSVFDSSSDSDFYNEFSDPLGGNGKEDLF